VGATQTIAASFASGGNNSAPESGLLARYKDTSNYYTGRGECRTDLEGRWGVETVLGSVSVANPRTRVPFTSGCRLEGTALTLTLNGTRELTLSDSSFGTGSLGYRGANGGPATSHWADDSSATGQ
jgi:hypothetical protein